MSELYKYVEMSLQVEKAKRRRTSYQDHLPKDGNFSEEELWEAIAEANGVDYSEIADGDLAEWL